MTFEVAIASHARAERVGRQTLTMLAEGGVPAECITLFVAGEEIDTYKSEVDPGLYGALQVGADSMVGQRHVIQAYYPEGQRVLAVDDDVKSIDRYIDAKTVQPVRDLESCITQLFDASERHGTRLWGLYPVHNPYFMKPRANVGLYFLIGSVVGYVNSHDPHLKVRGPSKLDYERTLRWWRRDGAVTRFEYLAANTHMFAPGGVTAGDRPDRHEMNEISVDRLLEEFGEFIAVKKKRSRLGREIRLLTKGVA